MSFLNWVLLGGIAAFTAPLIIHLLNRTRFKVVEWGAMHLLEAALQVNSQRIQWQSMLLLLMRCLIPILLALGLARPVFTSWRSAGGAGAKSLVILIDNSISMQAIDSSNATRFQHAIQQAQAVIKRQAPSTELSIWTMGGQPVDVLNGTTFDHARVSYQLASLPSGAGSVPVQSALAAAQKQASSMQNASREIIVISDFQDHEWKEFTEVQRAAIKQQLTAEKIPVQLTLLPIREPIAKSNLSVAIDAMEQPLVVVKQVFRVSAQVQNHGDKPADDVSIHLQVAGTEVASRRLAIPASGVTQAVFDCQIASPGTHVVRVQIDDTTGLTADNTSYQIVNVRDPLRVLIIDKQADALELERASGYLSLALSPFQSSAAGKNYMLTRTINPDQIVKSEIADHDVVVIVDAPRLNDPLANEIVEFVRQGGGLMLFSTKAIDTTWYNANWGAVAKSPLLPCDYLPQPKPPASIARISAEPTALHALGMRQLGSEDFAAVEVSAWHSVKLNSSSDASQSAAHVLLKLDNSEPLLVAKAFGTGHVVQFAISADTTGSNLPLRPIYVPLMQNLVQWLATGVEPVRNTTTGQSLAIKSPTTKAGGTPVDHQLAVVTLPDQSKVELQLDNNVNVNFNETAFPGVYSVTFGSFPNTDHSKLNLDSTTLYAVNAPANESHLEFLAPQKQDELATAMGASVAADAQELLTMQSLRANGREAWRWFLLAMIALLFVELWWQQRISRGPL